MIAQELSNEFNIDIRLIELLISRGIDTSSKMRRFLVPSINDLTPIEKYYGALAVSERLRAAIRSSKSILIYGDYDCDGICSVSMLYLFLKSQGAKVSYYIPNRHSDGYGINIDAVIKLKEQYNPDIIVTVDCGISAREEIRYIQDILCIEVIVTDHHILPEELPDCLIFNPKMHADAFNNLSGGGVVLRLIEAMSSIEEMLKYIDIAALSTIADIVPLIDDNRVIASIGIEMMRKAPRKGIKFIADIAKAKFTSSDIAYKIAPRINASGRLSDANKVVEIFLSEDYFLLQSIVKEIDIDNKDRRILSDKLYHDALNMLDNYDLINNRIIVLHNDKWDIGVLGIGAARIAREFKRPTILLTSYNGLYKGSGRSIEGVNLYELLCVNKSKYESFGGHSQAIGIALKPMYIKGIIDFANEQIESDKLIKTTDNFIAIDEINSIKLFQDIEKLEPYGCENNKPSFVTRLTDKTFAPITNTKHIKAKVQENIEIVGFNMIDNLMLINSGIAAEIKLDLNINNYNGFGQGIINNIKYEPASSDNEYTEALYLKQLLYKDITYKNYKQINSISQIYPSNNGHYGTLFIASRLNTCYNVINNYNHLRFNVLTKDSLNPIDTIILSPANGDCSRYYKRLIFVDMPYSIGYIDRFVHPDIEEIYIVNYDNRNISVDIDDSIFVSIRKILIDNIGKKKYHSLDDLYYKINKKYTYKQFATVFYIMYEQGIIAIDKEFNIKVADKDINLYDSEIYRRLNEH